MRFLTGTDSFRLRLRERALAADFRDAHPECTERVFDGRDVHEGLLTVLRETLSGGLFAAPRSIVIRHVELFDDQLSKAIVGLLSPTVPEDVLIVASVEPIGRAKKGNVLQVWLTKQAEVEEVNTLTGRALTQSILDMLHSIDAEAVIDPRALESLANRTAGATGYIHNNLLKLALLAGGRAITEVDVLTLTEEPVGESVSFAMLDALVRGNRERAITLLRQEETSDDVIFKLLGLFAWQVRQALMVRDEYDRGVTSPETIAATIGAKPFSVRKLMPLIPRLSLARLKRSLAYLSDLDRGLKTGQTRPGVALDLFVWKF